MKFLWLIIPIAAAFILNFIWYEAKLQFNDYPWIEMPTFFALIIVWIATVIFAIEK